MRKITGRGGGVSCVNRGRRPNEREGKGELRQTERGCTNKGKEGGGSKPQTATVNQSGREFGREGKKTTIAPTGSDLVKICDGNSRSEGKEGGKNGH